MARAKSEFIRSHSPRNSTPLQFMSHLTQNSTRAVMKTLLVLALGLISIVVGHSYITTPTSRTNQKQVQSRDAIITQFRRRADAEDPYVMDLVMLQVKIISDC